MKDEYKTIRQLTTAEFKDRGSKFIALASPVESEAACKAFLDDVKKEHPKARHHCYAYRLGLDENNFRANDDGEPSGTAGRPILGQIDSFGLTYVMIVVVRYFGGTLLGVSGLIHAYRSAAQAALHKSHIVNKVVETVVDISFDYAMMGEVMRALERLNIEMRSQDFGIHPSLQIAIRKSDLENTMNHLKAHIAGVPLEMASEMKQIPGVQIHCFE